MTESNDDQTVTLELERAEAILLWEWLYQMEDPDDPNDLPPFEQAVLTLRWNIVALLEKVYFGGGDWDEEVEAAIEEVRYEWYETD